MSGWPEGWSLERIQAEGWVNDVQELPNDGVYVVVQIAPTGHRSTDYIQVTPQLVLRLGNYCLVRPANEEVWLMGHYDAEDQSIACWGEVGTDLGAAIEGL